MAESILVTGKKISSMELVTNMTGNEKIPTGQPDDLALTPNQIADHTIIRGDLASQEDLSQVEVSLGTQITDLEIDVNASNNSIRGLIAAEEAARIAADDGLQAAIDAESLARTDADAGLQSALDAEVSARIAADDLKVDKDGSVSSVAGRVGDVELTPSDVLVGGFGSQEEVNKYVVKPFLSGEVYDAGDQVWLSGGDIVKSTVAGNTVDPNTDMSGWVYSNDASQVKYGNQNQAQINARTATPYDHGAIGDGLAHPLSERYATLAEAQAIYPAATSLNEYIDGHALNAWYRDICANNRKYATCHGNFLINIKLSNADINSFNNTIKTKRIDFNATVTMATVSGIRENGWEIVSPRQVEFSGFLELRDAGGLDYPNRKINNLLYMEDFIHAKFTWKVITRYARHLGLRAVSGTALSINGTTANNNTSDLGAWQFNSCGHRFKHGDFTFNSVTEIGGSQGVDQRSILTFESALPFGDDVLVDDFINYKGKPYLITGNTSTTISVYPWLHDSDTTGTIQVSWGGDFQLEGADSNQIKMSSGSSDCAVCAGKEGFYSGFKDQRVNEFNDIGCRVGNGINATQRRLTIAGLYFEGNVFDIVKTNISSTDNVLFINPNSVDLSKCHVLNPVNTSKSPSSYLNAPFTIINGNYGTYTKKNGQYANGQTPNTASPDLTIGDEHIKYRANSPTITLKDNPDFRRIFGNVDLTCEVFGSGGFGVNNNYTTGNTTIKCESGFTINGSSSDLVIPRSAPFWVSARLVSETDWRVFIYYSEKPKASKTHDWASLAAGAQQSTTLQVFGANIGDSAVASMDVALSGTSLRAEVTATNTVTVYHHNPTAAPVDVVSGTLTVKVV